MYYIVIILVVLLCFTPKKNKYTKKQKNTNQKK